MGVDSLFSNVILNGDPELTVYPCWLITAFFVITVGYIIPNVLVFSMEVSARKAFLRSRIPKHYASALCNYTHDAYRVASLALMSGVLALWFFLSLTRDLLYK